MRNPGGALAMEAGEPAAHARESVQRRDRAWLDGVRAGDGEALAALAGAYWSPLTRYAARLLGSMDAAEDVAQESFVRLWQRRESWKEDASARVLLFTITRNLAYNQLKSAAVRMRAPLDGRPHRADAPGPLQEAEGVELAERARQAIEALPARRREVFILSRYHELTRAEIAALVGLSQQTVANHLALAVADLRAALVPYLRP